MAEITGTGSNDQLTGTYEVDTIYGLGGDDRLEGGDGDDRLVGGEGDDTYVLTYRDARDVVIENVNGGTDTVLILNNNFSSLGGYWFRYVMTDNVENVTASGANVELIGNASNNVMRGTDVNDSLDGGAGADTLIGGAGNDFYYVDRADDVIVEAEDATGGTSDAVVTGLAFYKLQRGVEIVNGTAATQMLMGNDEANWLVSKGGSDTLVGGRGDDLYEVETGDTIVENPDEGVDIVRTKLTSYTLQEHVEDLQGINFSVGQSLTGNAASNRSIGSFSHDMLDGGAGDDTLSGFHGNDQLLGGAGDDLLSGGLGVDRLSGGAGADVFQGTRAELAGDTVVDFERGDVIRITDANPASFGFVQSSGVLDFGNGQRLTVTGYSGLLKAQAASGGGVELAATDTVRGDINGDGRADVLWRNDDGGLTNWLGRADGGFAGNDLAAFRSVPIDWQVAGVGDFNGDGRNDVLWRNSDGGLTDWLGRADGGFASNDAAASTTVPTDWQVAGVGDFNGDGRDDILWRNINGAMTNWLGRADGGFASNDNSASGSVPTDWKVAGVGDFNGDGRDDILWRNDDGALTNWLGRANGGFVGNDAAAFVHVTPDWHVQPHDLALV